MDKEEIVLEMMKLFWDTYLELYPEEEGFMFSASRTQSKDTFHLYKWSEMYNEDYRPEEWYRFREDK